MFESGAILMYIAGVSYTHTEKARQRESEREVHTHKQQQTHRENLRYTYTHSHTHRALERERERERERGREREEHTHAQVQTLSHSTLALLGYLQLIAFGVSFNLNLQFQSPWSLFIRMWQKRPIELDYRLRLEIEEMTLQMQ